MSTSTASRRSCHSIPPGQTTCFLDVRAADLQEEMAEQACRSVSSDEGGGNSANIAASGREQSNAA
jgi:hypothetical protein